MRWVRWFFRLMVFAAIGLPVAILVLVAVALDDAPAVARGPDVTPEQMERAKRLLKAHDPSGLPSGVQRSFSVSAEDLNVGLNVMLLPRGGAAKVALTPGGAMLWLSVPLPDNPFGSHANVEAVMRQTAGLPEFDQFRVGRVPVPAAVADWLLRHALIRLEGAGRGVPAADVLKSVRMAQDFLHVEYEWREDLPDRLRAALLTPEDEGRLRSYQTRLAEVTADPRLARSVALDRLLQPLMQHAASRSAGADPAAENRAALVVLAFYVNGRGLGVLVPSAREWPRPQPRAVTLSERGDFAQHFAISAAVAAVAGTPLADAVGVYKEVDDSRGGSGFSFTDLAADRAGTVFGERAVRSAQSARVLQQRVEAGLVEADFMPAARDLPEGLSEAEFKRRYGAVGSPQYREVAAVIERRLAALALYR